MKFSWKSVSEPFSTNESATILNNNNEYQQTAFKQFVTAIISENNKTSAKDAYNKLSSTEPFSCLRLCQMNSTIHNFDAAVNTLLLVRGTVLQRLLYNSDIVLAEPDLLDMVSQQYDRIVQLINNQQQDNLKVILLCCFDILFAKKDQKRSYTTLVDHLINRIQTKNDAQAYQYLFYIVLLKTDKCKKSEKQLQTLANNVQLLYKFVQQQMKNLNLIRSSKRDNYFFSRSRCLLIQAYYLMSTMKHIKDNKHYLLTSKYIYDMFLMIQQSYQKFDALIDKILINRALSDFEYRVSRNYNNAEIYLKSLSLKTLNDKQDIQMYNSYKMLKIEKYYANNQLPQKIQQLIEKCVKLLAQAERTLQQRFILYYYLARCFQLGGNLEKAISEYQRNAHLFDQCVINTNQLYLYYRKTVRRLKKLNYYTFSIVKAVKPALQYSIATQLHQKQLVQTNIFKTQSQISMIDMKLIQEGRLIQKFEDSTLVEVTINHQKFLIRKICFLSIRQYKRILIGLNDRLQYKGNGLSHIYAYSAQQVVFQSNNKQQKLSASTGVSQIDSIVPEYLNLWLISPHNKSPLALNVHLLNMNSKLKIALSLARNLMEMHKNKIYPINLNPKSIDLYSLHFMDFMYPNEYHYTAPENRQTGQLVQSEAASIFAFAKSLSFLFFHPNYSFESQNLKQLNRLLARMMDVSPQKRPTLEIAIKTLTTFYSQY